MGIDLDRLRNAKSDYDNELKAKEEEKEKKKIAYALSMLNKVYDYADSVKKELGDRITAIDDDTLNDILVDIFKHNDDSSTYHLKFDFDVPVLRYDGIGEYDYHKKKKTGSLSLELPSQYRLCINDKIILKQDDSNNALFINDINLFSESKTKYVLDNLIKLTDERFTRLSSDINSTVVDYDEDWQDVCNWAIFPPKSIEDLSNIIMTRLEEFGLNIVEPKIYPSTYDFSQSFRIDIVFKNPLE